MEVHSTTLPPRLLIPLVLRAYPVLELVRATHWGGEGEDSKSFSLSSLNIFFMRVGNKGTQQFYLSQ